MSNERMSEFPALHFNEAAQETKNSDCNASAKHWRFADPSDGIGEGAERILMFSETMITV